jgi:hypothetical protein
MPSMPDEGGVERMESSAERLEEAWLGLDGAEEVEHGLDVPRPTWFGLHQSGKTPRSTAPVLLQYRPETPSITPVGHSKNSYFRSK